MILTNDASSTWLKDSRKGCIALALWSTQTARVRCPHHQVVHELVVHETMSFFTARALVWCTREPEQGLAIVSVQHNSSQCQMVQAQGSTQPGSMTAVERSACVREPGVAVQHPKQCYDFGTCSIALAWSLALRGTPCMAQSTCSAAGQKPWKCSLGSSMTRSMFNTTFLTTLSMALTRSTKSM